MSTLFRECCCLERVTQKEKFVSFAMNLLRKDSSLDDDLEKLFAELEEPTDLSIPIAELVRFIDQTYPVTKDREEPSAILVFLAGWEQLRRVRNQLTGHSKSVDTEMGCTASPRKAHSNNL